MTAVFDMRTGWAHGCAVGLRGALLQLRAQVLMFASLHRLTRLCTHLLVVPCAAAL